MPVVDILQGFVIPAALAAAALILLTRLAPWELAKRSAPTAALVGGFFVGYALLALGAWRPEFHWHWLPYVALLTLPAGILLAGDGKLRIAGVGACLFVAGMAAWLLVPSWPHLEPSRSVYMSIWAPGAFALTMLLDPLTRKPWQDRLPVALTAAVLASAACSAPAVIFLSGSARFTQIAGAAAGAMLGVAIAAGVDRKINGLPGVAAPFAVLVSGFLLIAQTDSFSDVPLASYVLVPLAPLALWLAAWKPVGQLRGWKRWAALAPLPLLLLLAAVLMGVISEFGGASEY